uniref:Uncharacterized protein n=1 Tax=Nelumbo nucifera TaxID=4432 RepID=A0A822Z3A2_NELNU|nr:TPA_asm: hypothetical protein HUJ06_008570 [Nelumbo nucifera]
MGLTPEEEQKTEMINVGMIPKEGQYKIYSTATRGFGIINASTGSRRRGRPFRYQSSLKDHLDFQAMTDIPANLGPSLEELIGQQSVASLRKWIQEMRTTRKPHSEANSLTGSSILDPLPASQNSMILQNQGPNHFHRSLENLIGLEDSSWIEAWDILWKEQQQRAASLTTFVF